MKAAPAPSPLVTGDGPEDSIRARGSSVFLSDFVYIDRPYGAVVQCFCDSRSAWLGQLRSVVRPRPELEPAARYEAADRNAALFRIGRGPRALRPLVIVTTGPPRRTNRSVVVPLRWDPVSLEHLFPALEADLELSALDDVASRLSMSVTYRAPFKRIGESIDRLGMHRAAEFAVREFLAEIGEVVTRAESS